MTGPDAPRAASYANRTPETGDPELERYLRQLATLMDQRTAREADGQSPARWPHRDPGYDHDAMRQRQG
jgi:hypothetical protein